MRKILYVGLDPKYFQGDGHITHLPLIKIVPRPFESFSHVLDLQSYTHLIFTSKTAVRILIDSLNHSLKFIETKEIFVVGKVTAAYLKPFGLKPTLIAKEETAEGLMKEMIPSQHKESHFFWPHSALSRTIIPDFFKQHDLKLTECILYDTQTHYPEQHFNVHAFDEIVFTSPSTVEAFLEVFGKFPCDVKLTAIGPITAACLTRNKKLKSG